MKNKRAQTALLLLAAVCPLASQESRPALRLKSGRVPPNLLTAESPAALLSRTVSTRSAEPRRLHFLIQFHTYDSEYPINQLSERDIRVLDYVPDHALLVSGPEGVSLDDLGAVYAGLLEAEDKLSALLLHDDTLQTAILDTHKDVAPSEPRRIAAAAGLTIFEHPDLAPNSLLVRGTFAQFTAAAAWD